jgi:hypothetical protein
MMASWRHTGVRGGRHGQLAPAVKEHAGGGGESIGAQGAATVDLAGHHRGSGWRDRAGWGGGPQVVAVAQGKSGGSTMWWCYWV